MSEPRAIDLCRRPAVNHDPGVADREQLVEGVRWALVEYAPGQGRAEWCQTPHCGHVFSGALSYEFEDGREPLRLSEGSAFVLPSFPRHRGHNHGDQPARLFLIDALPQKPH